MKQKLTSIVDFFYFPFRRFIPLQTFRYVACGGANTLLGLAIFKIMLVYVFKGQNADFGIYVFKPHNAALFVAFWVNFIVGFLLMKYVVFIDSNMRGKIQLFRYLLAYFFNLGVNYFLLKLFVEIACWEAFISQCLTTAVIITLSYLSQKHFSFRVKK